MANQQPTAVTTLTPTAQAQLYNVYAAISSASLLGGIAGVVYSNKKHAAGSRFWPGVGWFFLGGIIVSATAGIIALPFTNSIIKKGTVTVAPETEKQA